MPAIKDFGGFKIRMFFHDHNPPHVHVMGPEFQALVSIIDGAVFAGAIPSAFRQGALDWIATNKTQLMEMWAQFQQ